MPPSQNRPHTPQDAPDPARTYERAKPEAEAGMGRLDNDVAVPTQRPDHLPGTVPNRQDSKRQVNSDDAALNRGKARQKDPDHSMHDEEPLGWDQAPQERKPRRQRRHPRTEGKGGTP